MKISIILIISIFTLCVVVHAQGNPELCYPDYIYIDCGVSNDYNHSYLQRLYKADAGFVDSGQDMVVSSELFNAGNNQQSKNLRAFPNGTRNCYTLRPKQGKGNTYLVRASFWYGNYDGRNQTPAFHLYIDTNYWNTVDTSDYEYKEAIYVAPRDYIQVCLVNIGLGVPFISLLELQLLDNSTYKIPSSAALNTHFREDTGSKRIYRYPQDYYDRTWEGHIYENWRLVTNSTPVVSPTSSNPYRVPQEVLMTAQERSLNDTFNVFWSSNVDSSWYTYIHVAEMLDLKGRVREMEIYMNNIYVDTICLQNQVPRTVELSNPTPEKGMNFTLKATERSDLPPLLNALEVFSVLHLPNSLTDSDDFESTYAIKKKYGIVKESWQGDPCVPQNMSWEGLNCLYDVIAPKIISVNLSFSNLMGELAPSFSNLTAMTSLNLSNNKLNGEIPNFIAKLSNLSVLDLSYNQLSGEIPEVLAELSNLAILNLSGNNLTGPIPEAIKMRVDSKQLQLSLDGNPLSENRTINAEKRSRNNIFPIVVASVCGVALVILLGAVGLLWRRIKKRRTQGFSTESKLKAKNRAFTYSEVLQITNNFDTVIGEGGFGKVYLGTLDNIKIAVKIPSLTSKQGYKEFEAEVQLLMVVHHRNLVSLVGYCDDIRKMAVICEYMPGGNLKEHLSENHPNGLSWIQRLQIAVDAGQGLDYLHHGCKPPIIHRDLKSSNILLTENMQAKIADFGLSKAFGTENESHISTQPAGTPGYLDPEFQSTGNLSRKSDVYSFGIILFELITGHSAILRGPKGSMHILHWVTPIIKRGDIESIMDPRLKGQFSINSAWKAVETAMSCVPPTAIQRPDISHVLQELKECLDVEISSLGQSQTDGINKTMGIRDSFQMATLELNFDSAPSAR